MNNRVKLIIDDMMIIDDMHNRVALLIDDMMIIDEMNDRVAGVGSGNSGRERGGQRMETGGREECGACISSSQIEHTKR